MQLDYLIKLFYVLPCLVLLFACQQRNSPEKVYDVEADIRRGYKFYSIHLNEDGEGYIIKGNCSYYQEPFKISSSDTSPVFKLDSSVVFFQNLNRIKNHPIFGLSRTDAARTEIYYNYQKVYDSYSWDETFWDLFRPIMEQLPKGFDPFRESDRPFDWD